LTLEDIENQLPWGLHDSYVERLDIDWTRGTVTLLARVMMGEHQQLDQRARVEISGLLYVSIEPPDLEWAAASRPPARDGLWVQPEPMEATGPQEDSSLPPAPVGYFRYRFHVSNWNRSFYICARDASFEWVERLPVAARSTTRALFPGSSI
jgi:hypothetical protein